VTAHSSRAIRHRNLAEPPVLAAPGSVAEAPPCVPSPSGRMPSCQSRASEEKRQCLENKRPISASVVGGASPRGFRQGAPRRREGGGSAARGRMQDGGAPGRAGGGAPAS